MHIYSLKGTITFTWAGAHHAAKRLDKKNKGLVSKKCAPFAECISEINNTQVNNPKDLDVLMRQLFNMAISQIWAKQ